MRTLLPGIAFLAFSTSAFGTVITINCFPVAGTNSFTVGTAVDFINASGTGSFACSDAGLGPHTLNSVTINLFSDYQFGDGTLQDPTDNSAGFTFTDGPDTWANAHGSPAFPITTMSLTTGVTVFVIGNAGTKADTFTNTNAGGLGGTSYTEPMEDSQTGILTGIFTIPVTAFVDAGGFTNGTSTARVTVTYDYNAPAVPEPASMGLVGGALLGLGVLGRRRLIRY